MLTYWKSPPTLTPPTDSPLTAKKSNGERFSVSHITRNPMKLPETPLLDESTNIYGTRRHKLLDWGLKGGHIPRSDYFGSSRHLCMSARSRRHCPELREASSPFAASQLTICSTSMVITTTQIGVWGTLADLAREASPFSLRLCSLLWMFVCLFVCLFVCCYKPRILKPLGLHPPAPLNYLRRSCRKHANCPETI